MNTVKCGEKFYTPSKIICVGRNYDDHISEMGVAERPEEPTVFLKPNSSISFGRNVIEIPKAFGLLHHEVELSFVAGRSGKEVSPRDAEGMIAGYAVGLDLTLRDLQSRAKSAGGPWTVSKGFDSSAVFSEFVPAESISDPCSADIVLSVDGEVRQKSNTNRMIFSPTDILVYASRYITIESGDIFMCGTPSGVGALNEGDEVTAEISGLPVLKFSVRRN